MASEITVFKLSWFMRLAKNILITLLYPLLIFFVLVLSNDMTGAEMIWLYTVMSPFVVYLLIYKMYRLQNYIYGITIDDNYVKIRYEHFGKSLTLQVPKELFRYELRRDRSTLWEYYVLVLTGPGMKIKQYEYDYWDKETLRSAVSLLQEFKIKGTSQLPNASSAT
jgi:hypothetical protein